MDYIDRIAGLPPEKRELLMKQNPLSFAQERLWFLHQLSPDSSVYNIPAAVSIAGDLDKAALERTINEILRRHEVLRTTFPAIEGQPFQVIARNLILKLPIIDLSELPGGKIKAELKKRVREEGRRPFDLATGPLVRAVLVKLGEQEHALLLTLHHIISDGWSTGVLIREVSAIYESYSRREPSSLPELPIQYADYALWQREYLQGKTLDAQMNYWVNQLRGAPALLELPTSRPRLAVQSFNGAYAFFEAPEAQAAALKSLSREEGVTLFMTLLAAFNILLYRYTGQQDIVVGTPVAGRNRPELESLIGFFVNTLVLRTTLDSDSTFKELLRRVRETALGAFANQDLPFEKLVEELQPARSMNHTPLFQVMFAVDNLRDEELRLQGQTLSALDIEDDTAKFDLMLMMKQEQGRLTGSLAYNTSLFDREMIERMAGHFQSLLISIAANPSGRVSELEMLSESERRKLLLEFNDTGCDYPRNLTIHDLFQQQVRLTPDSIAAAFDSQQLSYRELNRRSNQLANFLRGEGVGPEVKVGICLERSLEMIVAILGVLKAGGAYVPLDADYPQQRLAYMIDDSHIDVIIMSDSSLERLPQYSDKAISLRAHHNEIKQMPDGDPHAELSGNNLAYVMYTSGSTGKPVGISITHRGVIRLVKGTNYAQFGPNEVFLQLAPASFDASTFEIWGALLNGARLAIYAPGPLSLNEVGTALNELGITTLWLTAGLFHQMVDNQLGDLKHIKQLLAGGDVLSPSSVRKVLKETPGCKLINGYGPTENTTFTCCYVMTMPEQVCATVSIGKPISNTQVYLLDSRQKLVPEGVTGEINIGGEGLARCYVNRPDLSAERFIPNPFSLSPGDRLYRSGDLAYFLPDGSLHFLGRSDHQVKVRGYRIELSEVEAAFKLFSQIDDVAVVALDDHNLTKSLVAFVVAGQGHLEMAQLKASLRLRLPEYMIPAKIVVLEKLPLTPSGKLDRKALAHSHLALAASPEHKADALTAMTPTQQLLSTIFEQVLSLDQVWVDDNFFELGGHSLLATQVISRARELFSVELTVRALFEQPTVRGLSAVVDEQVVAATGLTRPPLVARERQGAMRLSFAQQRLWFIEQMEPETPLYNIAGAVRLDGELDGRALERAINEVVRRHEALRTSIQSEDGVGVQVVEQWEQRPLSEIDMSEVREEKREAESERVIKGEAGEPFKLSEGKLLRAKLIKQGAGRHILLYTMHHIISDGWSMGVLIREVGELYESYRKGEEVKLEEMVVQYGDYAEWQREWLEGEELERQMRYWRQQLGGELPRLEMATDRVRPAEPSYEGGAESVEIGEEVRRRLKEVCRQEGVTMFMLLMAGFKVLLSRYSGQQEIIVGSPVAGRNSKEVEGLIGMFVNTLVLRSKVRGEEGFDEMLRREREVALGAYQHQEVPFEKLVEELSPERDLSRSPLFQVMFAWQNQMNEAISNGSLRIYPLQVDNNTAKFDLTLYMAESDEGLTGALNYSSDLFDAPTIKRMVKHFQALLSSIAANPSGRVSELEMLSESERRKLLLEFNDTGCDYPRNLTIHDLFQQQVRLTPDSIAAAFDSQQLSYRELNRRSNQLANFLRGEGVGPEVKVGICLERSLEMIVAILGVLKAGGAYVPLDADYPQQRLAYMIDDSHIAAVITGKYFDNQLLKTGVKSIRIYEDWNLISKESNELSISGATGENLAYLIYTSGSTGKPKGVSIEHRSAVTLIKWAGDIFSKESLSSVLASTSICFDLSVYEIFVPLSCGGKIIIVTNALNLDQLQFATDLTLINTVPSAMAELLKLEAVPTSVRTINLAGEPLRKQLVDEIYKLGFIQKVCDLYGPSEDTTYTTFAVRKPRGRVTIGRPIAGTQIYLAGKHGEIIPLGAVGELRIGGAGLARGYFNRPELTAGRFVPNPFSESPGERLYCTGDRARYFPDGDIEFLGRVDHQVKIKGYRIELGEIESALRQHPLIEDAVVIARESESGNKRLAAYIVLHEAELSTGEIRQYLREKMPEYMVPSSFIFLERLPRTPSGKLDRNALPDPLLSHPYSDLPFQPPFSPIQQALASIFASTLGLNQVSIDDNFFELGGDSILSIQIIARANRLGIHLSPRQIFLHQTIRELAEIASADQVQMPVADNKAEGELELTPIQRWFFDQRHPHPHHYNQAVVLSSLRPLNLHALRQALCALVQHHDSLRLRFPLHRQSRKQHYASPEHCDILTVLDLTAIDPARRDGEIDRANNQAQASLDLQRGPIARAVLHRTAPDDHTLLIVVHHLAVDGVSWRILLEDLQAAYDQGAGGRGIDLGPKTDSYKSWSERLARFARSEQMEEQKQWWEKQQAKAAAKLPVDKEGGDNKIASQRRVEIEMSVEETSKIMKEVRRAYRVEVDEVLMSGLVAALSEWSGNQTVRVEVEGHGRQEVIGGEVSRTVGWFTTIYPVEFEIREGARGEEVLKEVKEAIRRVPDRGIGYGIQRYLVEEGEVREQEVEVGFNYLGQFDQVMGEEGNWRMSQRDAGRMSSEENQRGHLLEVNAMMMGGRVGVEISYSEEVHEEETVRRLGEKMKEVIEEIIEQSQGEGAGMFTPSDFPEANLSQAELDELIEDIEQLAENT